MKDSAGKAVKRKQTTLKTRKSLTGPGKRKKVDDDDESDDDFVPTKGASKTKPRMAEMSERIPSRTKAKKIEDSDDDFANSTKQAPSATVKSSAQKKEQSDSDDDLYSKPAPSTKKLRKEESDYDELPKALSKKAPAKAKAKLESDSDMDILANTKAKVITKTAAKRKR